MKSYEHDTYDGKYENEKYSDLFNMYLAIGVKYIEYVYNNSMIENKWITDVRNNEEAFFKYFI